MNFEKQFPSLKEYACWGKGGDLHYPILPVKVRAIIQKHCLDKAKVKEDIDKLISTIKEYKKNVMASDIITACGEEEHKARCMGYDDVLSLLINKKKELGLE